MEQIRVDMTPKGIKPVCHSSQYDKGRIIRLNLVDGIQGYTLTGEETLELEVRKPDNNIVTAEVQNTSSNYVLIVTTEQMTACEGDSNCEIRVRLGDTDIGSINFILRVEEDPLKDGIESETEIHNLHTQIEEINAEIIPDMVADEVARQYTGNVIFDDEPTENHGDGYAVNSAGLKAYIPKTIDELNDVEINNPQANQAIVYNPTTRKFENGEVSTVGGLNDLNDVTLENVANKQELVYDDNDDVFKNKTTRVELTQAEYDQLVADDEVLPDVDYYITDAPSMQGTSADLSYDGTTKSVYTKIGEVESDISDLSDEVDTKADSSDIPTVTDLSSSVTVGSMFNTPDYKKCYKYGKVCHLVMRAKLNSTLSNNAGFITLPSTVAPKGNDYAQILWYGDQYSTVTPLNCFFGSWDNNLHILGTVASGKYVMLDCKWITNA